MNEKSFKMRVKALQIFVAWINYTQILVLPWAAVVLAQHGEAALVFALGFVAGIKISGLVDYYSNKLKEIAEENNKKAVEKSTHQFLAEVKKTFEGGTPSQHDDQALKN